MISIENIFWQTLEAESTFDQHEQKHGRLAVREALTQKWKWLIRK